MIEPGIVEEMSSDEQHEQHEHEQPEPSTPALAAATDDELVEELKRRGWRHQDQQVPYQIPGPKDGPTYRVQQLQWSDRNKP